MHGSAPEFRQQITLHFDMFDIFGFRGIGNWRDFLIQSNGDGFSAGRIDEHFLRRAEQISRGPVPMLAFSAVHGQFDHMSVGAVKCLIDMKQGLYEVISGRNFGQAF